MCKKLFTIVMLTISLCMVSFSSAKLYSPDGRKISVNAFTATSYTDENWHAYPVCYVYSSDGTKNVIPKEALDVKMEDGWYSYPVTRVYSTSGESAVIPLSEAEQALSDGWYREKFATMLSCDKAENVLASDIEAYRSDGWFISEYIHDMPELFHKIKDFTMHKKGRYGVYVKNLSSGEVLVLNDGRYKSASIIKLYTMASVYSEISKGNLSPDNAVWNKLNDMITISDNYSHNYLIKQMGKSDYRMGFDILNKMCTENDCINTQCLSLFSECGEYVSYGSNYVSPVDCGILLEKIYRGEFIDKDYSLIMLDLLKRQTRRGKIPHLLPEGTVCANKTGETSTVESDVAIVYTPVCNYIICVITNNSPTAIKDIQSISKMTYDYLVG